MKRIIITISVLFSFFTFSLPYEISAKNETEISVSVFYQTLAPYGQWINDPDLGYLWVPKVAADFRPYCTNGQWVITQYGNTWDSFYPWGWICFHYGRWTYDNYYGWLWMPGADWAPSWVAWCKGYGFYGWAPLYMGETIDSTFINYNCPVDWWVFVRPEHIYSNNTDSSWNGLIKNRSLLDSFSLIRDRGYYNERAYNIGPKASEITTEPSRAIPVYMLVHATQPGPSSIHGKELRLYWSTTVDMTLSVPPNVIWAPVSICPPQLINSNPHKTFEFYNYLRNMKHKTRNNQLIKNLSETHLKNY